MGSNSLLDGSMMIGTLGGLLHLVKQRGFRLMCVLPIPLLQGWAQGFIVGL